MIVLFEDLKKIRKKYKDKTIVLGSGVFDLVHRGHVEYIRSLKKYGDIVAVMVKDDQRIRQGKGPSRPIVPEEDRVFMVNELKGVDIAFITPPTVFAKTDADPTYTKVFAELNPDVFYSTNPVWEKLKVLGGPKIIIGPRIPVGKHSSTTAIIEHIQNKGN